jgi:hypothetical protein
MRCAARLQHRKHATPSELHEPFYSKPTDLLSKVEGIELVTPARPDECKVSDHARAGSRIRRWSCARYSTPIGAAAQRDGNQPGQFSDRRRNILINAPELGGAAVDRVGDTALRRAARLAGSS